MKNITVRIDNSQNWAEILNDDEVIRRCHADSELIDSLTDLMKLAGATIEWTTVEGPRV